MSSGAPSSPVAGLAFLGRGRGAVKALSGFQKGHHTLPSAVTPATTAFLARLCATELAEAGESFFQQIRTALGYKRRDLTLQIAGALATLTARDFVFEIAYELEAAEPAHYLVRRTLHGVREAALLQRPEVDAIFARQFAELSLALRRAVAVETLVDRVEALESAGGLSVAYPSDCRECTITVPGVDATVRCTGGTFDVVAPQDGSPAELLAHLAAVRQAFAADPELAALLD